MDQLVWHNNLTFNPNKIITFVKHNLHGLLPLYQTEYQQLKSYSKSHNFPIKSLVSIRNLVKIQEEICRGRISPKTKEDIIESFKHLLKDPSKQSIYQFFSSHKVSVKNIIFTISTLPEYRNLSKDSLKHIFKYVKDMETADSKSKINSQKFEDDLSNWLKKHTSTPFKTELQIRSETATMRSTPDVLFDKPIEITVNGTTHKISWIDAKNYALVNVPFIIRSLTKQSDKYQLEIGPGAFVFHYGIDPSIRIGNTLLLDGSMIS